MRKIALASLALLLSGTVVPAGAAAAVAHLAEAYGTGPVISAVTLSGAGDKLAWVQYQGSQHAVVVYDYATRRVQHIFRFESGVWPRALQWDGPDMLLARVDMSISARASGGIGRHTLERVLALNLKTGKFHVLLLSGSGVQDVSSTLLLLTNPNRRHSVILFTYEWSANAYRKGAGALIHNAQGDSGWEGNLFSVDPFDGDSRVIARGNSFTIGWVVSRAGAPLAREQYHPRRHLFSLEAWHRSQWKGVYQSITDVQPAVQNIARRDRSVLAVVPASSGVRRLLAIPLDGGPPKNLLSDTRRSVLSLHVSRSGRLLGVTLDGNQTQYRWLDPQAKARYAVVAPAFPGSRVRVYDVSHDRTHGLLEVQSPVTPPTYYLTDFATGRATMISQAYPQLTHLARGATRTINYRTDDDRTVHATVFLPPGTPGANLPLVLLPPGGPVTASASKFNPVAGFLAANGYAVLVPRLLSSGVNGPATSAGTLRHWYGKSQTYAAAGVRALVKQKLVDPRRVCIVGVGYGGYAALAGAAFSPQTYACAVSVNGISDLPAFAGFEIDTLSGIGTASDVAQFWQTQLGTASDGKLAAQSPVGAAAAVRAPILLLHSLHDPRVPFWQSQEMAKVLTGLNKPVTLVPLSHRDQSLEHNSTRIAVLRAIRSFLHQNLH